MAQQFIIEICALKSSSLNSCVVVTSTKSLNILRRYLVLFSWLTFGHRWLSELVCDKRETFWASMNYYFLWTVESRKCEVWRGSTIIEAFPYAKDCPKVVHNGQSLFEWETTFFLEQFSFFIIVLCEKFLRESCFFFLLYCCLKTSRSPRSVPRERKLMLLKLCHNENKIYSQSTFQKIFLFGICVCAIHITMWYGFHSIFSPNVSPHSLASKMQSQRRRTEKKVLEYSQTVRRFIRIWKRNRKAEQFWTKVLPSFRHSCSLSFWTTAHKNYCKKSNFKRSNFQGKWREKEKYCIHGKILNDFRTQNEKSIS